MAAQPVPVLGFELPAEPRSVRSARGWVLAFAAEHNAGPDVRERLALAITEAFTNAVKHAYEDGPGVIRVAADIDDGTLEVVVLDEGRGFRSRTVGGLGAGLGIIAQTADAFAIRERSPHGTELWLQFSLR